MWATSYLLGPGFLLGTDTAVRLTEVAVGPLPTVPLLAGLPEGPVGAAGAGLLAFPVLAGMAAGWMLTRRLVRARQAIDRPTSARAAAGRPGPAPVGPGWPELLGAAALAGPIAGIMLGLLALISGGALGAGRLAQIGPVPWQTAVTCAAVVTVSSLIGAAVTSRFPGAQPPLRRCSPAPGPKVCLVRGPGRPRAAPAGPVGCTRDRPRARPSGRPHLRLRSNLQALLDAAADPAYGAKVVAVGADREAIAGLDRAAAAGVPTFVDRVKAYPTRDDWDAGLTAHVAEHKPDLVISAGFLKLVGDEFLGVRRPVRQHPQRPAAGVRRHPRPS